MLGCSPWWFFSSLLLKLSRLLFLQTSKFRIILKVGSNLVLAEWTAHFSPETNWNYIGYYRFHIFV